jgi:hypothetical protein
MAIFMIGSGVTSDMIAPLWRVVSSPKTTANVELNRDRDTKLDFSFVGG